jgi:hypothetical protein
MLEHMRGYHLAVIAANENSDRIDDWRKVHSMLLNGLGHFRKLNVEARVLVLEQRLGLQLSEGVAIAAATIDTQSANLLGTQAGE